MRNFFFFQSYLIITTPLFPASDKYIMLLTDIMLAWNGVNTLVREILNKIKHLFYLPSNPIKWASHLLWSKRPYICRQGGVVGVLTRTNLKANFNYTKLITNSLHYVFSIDYWDDAQNPDAWPSNIRPDDQKLPLKLPLLSFPSSSGNLYNLCL